MSLEGPKFEVASLRCPVTLEDLTEAVSLTCEHKINEVAAKSLYGLVLNGFCEIKGRPCPLCREIVKGYKIDHTIRELARQLTSGKIEQSPPKKKSPHKHSALV